MSGKSVSRVQLHFSFICCWSFMCSFCAIFPYFVVVSEFWSESECEPCCPWEDSRYCGHPGPRGKRVQISPLFAPRTVRPHCGAGWPRGGGVGGGTDPPPKTGSRMFERVFSEAGLRHPDVRGPRPLICHHLPRMAEGQLQRAPEGRAARLRRHSPAHQRKCGTSARRSAAAERPRGSWSRAMRRHGAPPRQITADRVPKTEAADQSPTVSE